MTESVATIRIILFFLCINICVILLSVCVGTNSWCDHMAVIDVVIAASKWKKNKQQIFNY